MRDAPNSRVWLRLLAHPASLVRQACDMNGEWGPATPLDDDFEMERSGAASETPAPQRQLHAALAL
eukprot:12934305-Prorocentrum_lima.AAC.1